MKIDEQKEYDKLLKENKKLSEENKSLRSENLMLHGEVRTQDKKILADIALIGSLKNCSWSCVFLSFVVSVLFGLLIEHSLRTNMDWNAMLGTVLGVWWSGVFVYYCSWRWKFK